MSDTMTVYQTKSVKSEMETAPINVGFYRDEKNRPLVVVGDRVLGPLHDVRDYLIRQADEFERREGDIERLRKAVDTSRIEFEAAVRRVVSERGTKWR